MVTYPFVHSHMGHKSLWPGSFCFNQARGGTKHWDGQYNEIVTLLAIYDKRAFIS